MPAILFGRDSWPDYVGAYVESLKMAFWTTVLCLLLGYPMAYAMARAAPAMRNTLLVGVMIPFWTSFLLRVSAWIGILRDNGILNNLLLALHVIDAPIPMMNTNCRHGRHGVQLRAVHDPAAVLAPREARHEAARSGRRSWRPAVEGVREITLPLSKAASSPAR